MDTTAPTPAQNDQQVAQPQVQPVAVQPQDQQQVQQSGVQAPAGQSPLSDAQQPMPAPAGKESAPVSNATDSVVIPQPEERIMQETAPEAKVAPELKEAGVEATKRDVIEVHPDVAKTGVTPTGTAVPMPTVPDLKLPLSEENAQQAQKRKKFRDSITWLATLVLRQIKQMNFKKKNKKGETGL